jgi:HK97 gp10 family phage protein
MPDVEGLEELVSALQNTTLSLYQRSRLIEKGLRAAGNILAEEQRRRAPDDPDTSGSRVERNIGVSVLEQTPTGAMMRAGMKKWGYVGRFAEFGTIFQTARPWMGPAFDDKVDEAVDQASTIILDGIEEAFLK